MSFKNALKMLVAKFGYVWVLLIYILIVIGLIFCFSLPFVLPIISLIKETGISAMLNDLFASVINGSAIEVWFDHIYIIMNAVKDLFAGSTLMKVNTVLLLFLVLGVIYRLVLGLYEIPLTTMLEGAMSSNAKFSFVNSFISKLGFSVKYSLVKMMYTLLIDFCIFFIIFNEFALFSLPYFRFFAPFIIMLTFLILVSLRYTAISMWAPSIIVGQKKIFSGFAYSVKKSMKFFGSVYSSFVIAWTLIVAFNVLVGLFTFGAGLLASIPISMLFVAMLNMTLFYGKHNKRYYVDVTVINPPQAKE